MPSSLETPSGRYLYERMKPGDLVPIGARPGQGKTLMSLEIAAEAMREGHRCVFFSLEYTERDMTERLRVVGGEAALAQDRLVFEDRARSARTTSSRRSAGSRRPRWRWSTTSSFSTSAATIPTFSRRSKA